MSCISDASGKGYKEIFQFCKQIETAASEITKKQPVTFNTFAGCRATSYILL